MNYTFFSANGKYLLAIIGFNVHLMQLFKLMKSISTNEYYRDNNFMKNTKNYFQK